MPAAFARIFSNVMFQSHYFDVCGCPSWRWTTGIQGHANVIRHPLDGLTLQVEKALGTVRTL